MSHNYLRGFIWASAGTLAFASFLKAAGSPAEVAATVTITGVSSNHSSVRVYYKPVPGARDYRVYDVSNPDDVKYAGMIRLSAPHCPGPNCTHHFAVESDRVTPVFPYRIVSGAEGGPQALDVPALQIDWNGVGDTELHTLIVEAVDELGPVPHESLYSGPDNMPLVGSHSHGAMLGSNKGPTGDGKLSANGQGPYTNKPKVIARSPRFIVQADRNYKPIPSKPTAVQTFFDTFEDIERDALELVSRIDRGADEFGNFGIMKYLLNAGTPKAWEIDYRQADNENSMPFIASNHFMDMLFDGATPGTNAPSHMAYASMAMSPLSTFEIADGKIAHLTMEVDGHQSGRRWMALQIAPASDPLKAWNPGEQQINVKNHGLFLDIRDGGCTLDVFSGSVSASERRPTGSAGGEHGPRLWGAAGQAQVMCGPEHMFIKRNMTSNGLGLDDKSRYDFFLSQSFAAFFQDGQLIVQSEIPAGSFSWANAPLRAYFTHYVYHSANDVNHLKSWIGSCHPMNSYWFNDPVRGTAADETPCKRAYPAGYGFPHSDERHWDNMGFEVLPATEATARNFSRLATVVQPPAVRAPKFTESGGPRAEPPTGLPR